LLQAAAPTTDESNTSEHTSSAKSCRGALSFDLNGLTNNPRYLRESLEIDIYLPTDMLKNWTSMSSCRRPDDLRWQWADCRAINDLTTEPREFHADGCN
jgi:hypothetical protein